MFIYEKKVENNRQVWGTMGSIPDNNSVRLTYKDQDGSAVTPLLNYKYNDDGFGGIMMNNGNAEIPLSVFIGNDQVVPTVLAESITLSGNYKTAFLQGDQLDVSGLSVTAVYKGGREDTNVVGWKTTPSANSILNTASNNKKVTVTYQGASAEYAITVSGVNSVAWTTPPTKVSYTEGESLDLSGAVITATYADNSNKVVTNGVTFTPANNTVLNTSINAVVAEYYGVNASQTLTVDSSVEEH